MSASVKQYDYGYALETVLTDADGAVDLSTATEILLVVRRWPFGDVLLSAEMTADLSTTGRAFYTVQEGDFIEVGSFKVEYRVTWASAVRRVPSDGYGILNVLRAAAPAA